MQPNLFDSPADRVLGALPRHVACHLRTLLAGDPLSPPALHARVDEHLHTLAATAERDEFLDLPLARRLATICHGLVDRLDHASPAQRPLIQAAVLYFVQDPDGEADHALLGLDDDELVLRTVLAGIEPVPEP